MRSRCAGSGSPALTGQFRRQLSARPSQWHARSLFLQTSRLLSSLNDETQCLQGLRSEKRARLFVSDLYTVGGFQARSFASAQSGGNAKASGWSTPSFGAARKVVELTPEEIRTRDELQEVERTRDGVETEKRSASNQKQTIDGPFTNKFASYRKPERRSSFDDSLNSREASRGGGRVSGRRQPFNHSFENSTRGRHAPGSASDTSSSSTAPMNSFADRSLSNSWNPRGRRQNFESSQPNTGTSSEEPTAPWQRRRPKPADEPTAPWQKKKPITWALEAERQKSSDAEAPTPAPSLYIPVEEDEEFNYSHRRKTRDRERSDRFDVGGRSKKDSKPGRKGKERETRESRFLTEEEFDDAREEHEALKARKEAKKQRRLEKARQRAEAATPILLPEYISVTNLAMALNVRHEHFIAKMEELGFEDTSPDYILNAENAGLIAMEYKFEPIIDRAASEDLRARPPPEDKSLIPSRPPVVTIMGHVDHGKTTLLDWLRKSSVAATEHGGITQHIGAFSVAMPSGKLITFLDTPGHAAFLSMRQRGANVTDIVVLVVAADDSVKPQTLEALNHAKVAQVPIIVAINKIDKEAANVDRVKQDLARAGVEIEDFGGDTQVVCVSGKTGQGMLELEEAVITLSEILDTRAETDGPAEGWVLESSKKADGKVATVLVKRGTLRLGDFIVAGNTWARIRLLRNEAGLEILEAPPGTPVEILGWREQPAAGDEVLQAPDESKAKSVVEYRLEKEERDKLAQDMEAINLIRKEDAERKEKMKLEAKLAEEDEDYEITPPEEKEAGPTQVCFIVKGDVHGSVEAVVNSVTPIGNNEVRPHILRAAPGAISEFDIDHAAAACGHLINFNIAVEPEMRRRAETKGVSILDYNVIYHLVDGVKEKLSEKLAPLTTQRVLGEAEIAQIFEINLKRRKTKPVAGCKVKNGVLFRNSKVRILRGGEKIYDGTLDSLKHVKKDILEIRKGSECGMEFTDFDEFQLGDQVQAYEEKQEKRYL